MNKNKIRKILTPTFPVLDVLLSPFTLLASILLLTIRKIRVSNMPISKKIFQQIGVFPISSHYYEPLFDHRMLRHSIDTARSLPGIYWNENRQLELLEEFHYQDELLQFPYKNRGAGHKFFYENPSLGPGDAELLYCMIRHFKPKRMIEIGSGYSTLMAEAAVKKNREEDAGVSTEILCIEPYEMPWLEKISVKVMRKKVEEIDASTFKMLSENDILFIDSSHMIRPQGDVLYEILELIPSLRDGVIIHVHDIFTPRDYTKAVLIDEILFWNEQYLLEAFLSFNQEFEIVAALNFLKTHFPEKVMNKLPLLAQHKSHEPGSFWIRKKGRTSKQHS